MTDVLHLPQPANLERVETGAVQFGDDWPGVFIRGDTALFFSIALRQAAHRLTEKEWLIVSQLIGLAETLQSCSVGDTGWPPSKDTITAAATRDHWLRVFEARKRTLIADGMSPDDADAKAALDVRAQIEAG